MGFQICWKGIKPYIGQCLTIYLNFSHWRGETDVLHIVLFLLIERTFRLFIKKLIECQPCWFQFKGNKLFLRFPGEFISYAQFLCKLSKEFPFRPTLVIWFNSLFSEHKIRHTETDIIGVCDAPFFKVRTAGRT